MVPALAACRFETERLLVAQWRSLEDEEWASRPLHDVVASLLTVGVTRSLPPSWQGRYTPERARGWIDERDAEGTTLLAVRKSDGEPLGLVILFEAGSSEDRDGVDVRLGYLLAEEVWGRGIASELLAGFVGWCRLRAAPVTITGGVALDNVASARVLEKNGFRPLGSHEGLATGERLYRLELR